MDRKVIIAPLGQNIDALFVGLNQFPADEVILISPPHKADELKRVKARLTANKVSVRVFEIEENTWEELFRAVSRVVKIEDANSVIVNVATGDRSMQCAATSAAFVNGLKAIDVNGDDVMLLPILKFSYYKLLTDRKLELLALLDTPGCCESLEALAKKTAMSLPLVSYHVNGNLKSDGLKQLGLVESIEKRGRVKISISTLGRMLLKGYITYSS